MKPKLKAGDPVRMRDLFVAGKTMRAIGFQFGITRERVRQILLRDFGMTSKDGGAVVDKPQRDQARDERRKAYEAQRDKRRDRITMRVYGCTFDEAVRLNGGALRGFGTPASGYRDQRRNAYQAGVGWELSFPQWLAIWMASGVLEKRGRGSSYWLVRIDKRDAFKPGNVEVRFGPEFTRDLRASEKSVA